MLLHSKFASEEIEREKGVIIEEINMYEDTPMRKISDLYENLLYGDTKLGRDVAGRPEVIRSIKREDFKSYISRFYSPSNTIVAVAGGTNIKGKNKKLNVNNLAEKYLGKWEKRQTEKADTVRDLQTKPGVLVRFKDTQQAHLCIGVR